MRIPTRIWATTGFVVAAALLVTGGALVATASSASAGIISDGGALSLDSTPGALSGGNLIAPGDTMYWPISANLDASTSGALTLKVMSGDALASDPGGLRLTLASCADAWTIPAAPAAPTCDSGESTIIPDTAFANISPTKVWNLGQLAAVSQLPMMATISLPENVPSDLQGTTATMKFGFTALGDTENASPSDPGAPVLGFTGVDPTGPALLGLGLLLAGAVLGRLRVLASRRRDEAVA